MIEAVMTLHRYATSWRSVLFAVATCIASCQAFDWQASHSVAVLGNYLYIHGGRTTRQVAGQDAGWSPENTTWAIPIDRSWSVGSGSFEKYAIEDPDFVSTARPAMWPDPSGTRMYTWGGASIDEKANRNSNEPRLTTFVRESNTSAGGKWERGRDKPKASSGQELIHRTHLGSWTSCNGLGFYMGGYLFTATDNSTELWGTKKRTLPGLLIYDMKDGTWTNQTADAFGQGARRGTHLDGYAVCLPTLGTKNQGIVVLTAGRQATVNNDGDSEPVPMDRVTFYDIGTRTWHTQKTTGVQTPSQGRRRGCAVAATDATSRDRTGAYEIFMFGGLGITPADLWVLTVPGFRWFQAPPTGLPPTARSSLDCAVAGRAQRQMIAVGGDDENKSAADAWDRPDDWPRNMQVLDLTSLEWSGDYAADAPPYRPPAMVADWNRDGGLAGVQWEDPSTRALFADVLDGRPGDGQQGRSPPSAGGAPTDSSGSAETGGTDVAAIAGGVAGGVGAVLVAAAAGFYFCWYRPRRRRVGEPAVEDVGGPGRGQWHQAPEVVQDVQRPQKYQGGLKDMAGSPVAQAELESSCTPPVHELDMYTRRHELA
ncbi:hypothetical protein MCOR17_010792 [Pyricularia oryzae]|nr:hypothetical protein MCOR17_010792 [Pyricularia oryzae]